MTESGTPSALFRGRRPAWVVTLALAAVLCVVYWFRVVFGPLLLALAFAYILEPLVQRLTRRGWGRPWAVALIFTVMLVLFLLLMAWLALQGTSLVLSLSEASGRVPAGVEHVIQAARAWVEDLPPQLAPLKARFDELAKPDVWKPMVLPVLKMFGGAVQLVMNGLASLGMLVLMPLYLCYLMLDLELIWQWLKRHLPAHNRDQTLRVLGEVHKGMAAFLRGRVVVAFLKGALTSVGLLFCGTPMAVVVGLAAGILSIVPFIGPFVGFAVAMALTLAETQAALGPAIGVLVVFGVAEAVEGFILTPWVMGKEADLGSLAIIFSVIFWGAALGLFGALVAIPLTLILKILYREYVLPSVEELAEPNGESG
ncbi:MAG: AI-2E family transporter [Planctomycetota bacterium]|jgi:predicted PurR-regulated permease PerM